MITVYEADNAIDAHLLRGLLEQCGIDAHVSGEFLLGAMGDLPAQGLLRVMVAPDDFAAARALVIEFEDNMSAAVSSSGDQQTPG